MVQKAAKNRILLLNPRLNQAGRNGTIGKQENN